MKKILLSPPHMSGEEQEFIKEAFDTNWIAPLGANVDGFEQDIIDYTGCKAALAVSSGTAAIHLALVLLEVQEGDIVFCSSSTFVASANPVRYQGAELVFIDSDESWNMSPKALQTAFESAEKSGLMPKAVIVVNLYGQSAKYDEIVRICKYYGVPVIEDAAESLGAAYQGQASGTFGLLGIYSFNGNKILSTSGGGMLISDNEELINKAKYLSTQAKLNTPYYSHDEVGFNYRMSNVLAGIGRGQMKVLSDRVRARRENFRRYQEGFKPIEAIEWMPEIENSNGTRWLSTFLLNPQKTNISAAELIKYLDNYNIEARRVWNPLHRQRLFQKMNYYEHETHSVSDLLFENGVCLPSGSNLTKEQQVYIIDVINDIMSRS